MRKRTRYNATAEMVSTRPIAHARNKVDAAYMPLLCLLLGLGIVFALVCFGVRLRVAAGVGTLFFVVPIAATIVISLIPQVERVTRKDLNRDGVIGEPVERSTETQPSIIQTNNRVVGTPVVDQDTHDVSDPNRAYALDLAEFVQHGDVIGFTEAAWKGYTFQSGTKMTQPKYRDIKKTLIDAGILTGGGRGQAVALADNLTMGEAVRRIFHS